jgi:S-adenosylhomocysteine hydrolase
VTLPVPREVEEYVATAKLASMGITIDAMTADQKKYGESWEHRT